MVHYTCDMCGRPLLADEDIRYVVKIEVYTACDAMDDDDDDDDDDIDEEIWEMEEDEGRDGLSNHGDSLGNGEYKAFRFDLCVKCHKKYLQDPLFLKSWNRTRFSEN